MSLEGYSDEQIQEHEAQLLETIATLGSPSGNVSLLRELGWEEGVYWSIRDRLVDSGQLQLGRGRGGSVLLVERHVEDAALVTEQEAMGHGQPATPAEVDLYEPIAEVLRNRWARDNRFRNHIVAVTARQGARDTGGTWTRPDLTVASVTTHLYVPGKHFDVATFEVKPVDGVDVTAVFEALAHRRAATRAYVFLHVPDTHLTKLNDLLTRICEEAKRHGVGVIVAASPDDYETWDTRVEPVRCEPEPAVLNNFIAVQFSEGDKQEIATWFR